MKKTNYNSSLGCDCFPVPHVGGFLRSCKLITNAGCPFFFFSCEPFYFLVSQSHNLLYLCSSFFSQQISTMDYLPELQTFNSDRQELVFECSRSHGIFHVITVVGDFQESLPHPKIPVEVSISCQVSFSELNVEAILYKHLDL